MERKGEIVGEFRISSVLKKETTKMWMIVYILFVLSVLIRSRIIPGVHLLITYYDELLYWGLSKTFLTPERFTIQHTPTEFYKFFYSFSLSPLFLIKDGAQRADLAHWVNIFFMSFSIFPTYRIARRITPSKKIQICSLLLFLLSPIMNYAEKYVPETLYLPMSMYLTLGYLTMFTKMNQAGYSAKKMFVFSGMLGMYAGLCYFEREASSALVAGFLITGMIPAIQKRKQKDSRWIQHMIVVVIHAAGFAVCVTGVNLILHLSFSYGNQVNAENLNSLYKIEYFVYCLLCNGLYVNMAFFAIPVLFILFRKNTNRSMEQEFGKSQSEWIKWVYISFGIMLIFLTYSVSCREELGRRMIRIHTRYFIPFLLPFFALGLEGIRRAGKEKAGRGMKALLCLGAACVIILSPGRYVSAYDAFDLWQIKDASDTFDQIAEKEEQQKKNKATERNSLGTGLKHFVSTQTEGEKEITFHHGQLLMMILFCGATVLVYWLTYRRRKAAMAIFCILILLTEGYNNAATVRQLKKFISIPNQEAAAFVEMDSDIQRIVGDENLLVISTSKMEDGKRKLETLLSGSWYSTLTGDLKILMDDNGVVDLDKKQIRTSIKSFAGITRYPKGTRFPYVLCKKDVRFNEKSAQILRYDPETKYTLYKMEDPTRLDFEYIKDVYDESAGISD